MSIFIQEVLGLLKRNQKKITLDKSRDWFEFGKLYQTSVLNTGASYNPKMDPFVIKWGDLVCQATEDLTRTLPGEGNLGFVPVYTDPSGYCSWDTLKDSIITQNALNTIITIGGNLVVTGDVAINGCDLTSTCTSFNLLNQPTTITFGSGAANIFIGRADPTSTVTIVGTQDSNACTNGALVVNGGVGIAKNLNVCGIVSISNTTQSTSCTTGALVVAGGVGIAKDLFVCGNATITGDAAINGGDLTSTASNFNLLHQSTTIGFGYTSQTIYIGGISATSTVIINGTQDSTSCSTGAFRVVGGVGIAKNLHVCGNTYLNEYVFLGDALSDEIALNGTLLDNNGSASAINQALVGTGTGAATWQNVALVGQVCAVNSIPLWTPNSSTLGCSLIYQNGNSSTPATKIFFQGGLASEGSQVRTITDIALGLSNYAGGEASAAFGFRSLALGGDSFACGHKGFAGGHGSLAAGYNTGAGNYGFGLFVNTITSSTLDINILSGTIAVGDFIIANVDIDPSIRYEILTLIGTGTIGINTITIATPISVNSNEAVAIEEAVPNRGDSQGAIAFGYNAASKGIGAIAIGSLATTDISNQIAIGSGYTTVKLGGTYQDNTLNKILVLDANEVVRWRDASTITPVTADNGLTMSTASNVQLGGTLIQDTNIFTANYRIRLSSNSVAINPVIIIDALGTGSTAHGIRIGSIGGFAGYFESTSGLGAIFADNSGTSPTVTFQQSNGQVVGKFTRIGTNNTGIGNILDLYNTCSIGPAVVGLGAAINFNMEDNLSVPANAGTISFDWTSFASGNSSRFVVKTVGFGISSNKLEVSNEGLLKLNLYGAGAFYGGTATYGLGVTSTGDVIETVVPYTPKLFTALLSQSGNLPGDSPTMTVLWDYSAGAVTFTWSRVSAGLYELTASQPTFFGTKTAYFIIPDVNPGKAYCAAIERVTDTVLRVNSFDMTGVSDDNCFDRATFKFEIYT
jgi:hypothetical protein